MRRPVQSPTSMTVVFDPVPYKEVLLFLGIAGLVVPLFEVVPVFETVG
jgi:hypothetical protein